MYRKLIFILFVFTSISGFSQEAEKKLQMNGYVKLLGTFSHFNTEFLPPILSGAVPGSFEDYLIHNRLNFNYYPSEKLSFGLGMRNRLFWGYLVSNDPTFQDRIGYDPGLVDLSFFYWKEGDVMLNTAFDRAWGAWTTKKWALKVGRQRVNWGVNTVWNPNDIFNQYNYLDFDYEERPGTDAVRLQFFPNFRSSWELTLSPAKELENSVGAILYKFNKWNYDIQFLGGYYKKDAVAGTGFAGNLWTAGLKGEMTYYHPLTDDTESNFTASGSVDYQFSNGIYVLGSYLFNGLGTNSLNPLDLVGINNSTMSAKNLFFFKHTIFAMMQYNITPLFNVSVANMVTPDFNNFILFPSLTYSLTQDLDALLTMQLFVTENPLENYKVQWMSGAIFGRLKYSF